jgi:hypothetical protein
MKMHIKVQRRDFKLFMAAMYQELILEMELILKLVHQKIVTKRVVYCAHQLLVEVMEVIILPVELIIQ